MGTQHPEQLRQFLEAGAQTRHAGINLQVHANGVFAQALRGPLEPLDVFLLPDGRSQMVFEHELFVAAPETGHQQDGCGDAAISQRQTFICRCNTEPVRTFLLQRARALDRAMTVSVRLDHSTYCRDRGYVIAECAEVLAKCGK